MGLKKKYVLFRGGKSLLERRKVYGGKTKLFCSDKF